MMVVRKVNMAATLSHPQENPVSLDVYLHINTCSHCHRGEQVYSANITHNLNTMANAAGIYRALWRPEELGVTTAAQLIPLVEAGLARLLSDPGAFKVYDDPGGWGLYEHFVPFVERYLAACRTHPEATVSVSR
jgi:hypothetical protein